jgi:glycerophosphoryl diester phosphodiesterase
VGTFFRGNGPLIAAHRGFPLNHPENTLPAFQAALDNGADFIETDIHGSRDGVAMIAHDPGLWRVAGRSGMVNRIPASELARVDLGGASMPTLIETLYAFPDTRFSVDVKDEAAISGTIDAITRTKAHNRVMIASFSHRRRNAVLRGLPGVTTSGTHRHVLAGISGIAPLSRILTEIDALFMPTTAYGISLFSPSMVAAANSHGVALGAWTINDPDDMSRLWRAGARVIVTDRTDLAHQVRAELAVSPTNPSQG